MTEPTPSEVEELRAEVARLRAQLAAPPTAALPVERHPRGGWWRPVVATILIILMAVLAPLAVVARWAHDTVSDTDQYVATVGPLASEPAVQSAVIDRITTEITTRLQVDAVTNRAVDALAARRDLPPVAEASLRALSGPLTDAIDGFVQQHVTDLVESDEFETAWLEANRQAHTQLVAVLTGKSTEQVQVTDNSVTINLAPLIDRVKQRLIDRGFALAERLPTVNAQFTIFQSDDVAKAQTAFRLLDTLNTWLPILALLCLAGAVAVGRSRRRTLVAGAIVLAVSMLALGAGLNLSREIYLDAVPTDQLPTDAAAAIYDTLVHFIRLALRALLVVALAVAFIAWVSGPEGAPVALRRGTSRAIGAVRQGGTRVGLDTGRFGVALYTYKTPIRIAVLGVALLVYVLRDHPTGAFAIWVLLGAALVLLVVELLSRPPAPSGPAPPPAET